MNNTLAAKVKAQNMVNAEANNIRRLLVDYFQKFLNQKIYKADGTFLEKIKQNLPAAKYGRLVHCRSAYGVYFKLDFNVKVEGREFVVYAHQDISIGDVSNNILTKLFPTTGNIYRDDYTPKEIINLREQHQAAMKIARDTEFKLSGFGFFDN